MMATAAQGRRIPDLALQRVGGGELNPSALIGQKAVVLFCPADPAAAAREIEDYRALAKAFEEHGVWIIGILADGMEPSRHAPGEPSIALMRDPSGIAWATFAPWLESGTSDRAQGAAFLFEQWGCLGHAWAGAGHANSVLEEAQRRR